MDTQDEAVDQLRWLFDHCDPILIENDKKWYKIISICKILKLTTNNTNNIIKKYPNYTKKHSQGDKHINLISLEGIVPLIFKSKIPEAISYQNWIYTHTANHIKNTHTQNIVHQT
jgi:prophage antirepressor-like protein